MAGDTLFGIPIEEVRRQLNANKKPDYDPIRDPRPTSDVTLEPCIEQGKKILTDPNLRAKFRKILVGRR